MASLEFTTISKQSIASGIQNLLDDFVGKVKKQEKINLGLSTYNLARSIKTNIRRSILSGKYHLTGKWTKYGGASAAESLRLRRTVSDDDNISYVLVMIDSGKPTIPSSVKKKWVWSPSKYMLNQRYSRTRRNYRKHIYNPIRRTQFKYNNK